MESLSKYDIGINYLLCPIDSFRKYAWVIPLKGKTELLLLNFFKLFFKKNQIKNGLIIPVNFIILSLKSFE